MSGGDAAGRFARTLATLTRDGAARRVWVVGVVDDVGDSALRGCDVITCPVDRAPRIQLARQVDVAALSRRAWQSIPAHEHRQLMHNLAGHLTVGGMVIAERWPDGERSVREHAMACALAATPSDTFDDVLLFRRTERFTVHDLAAEARASLIRLTPHDVASRIVADPDCLVLDTRTPTDRARFGIIAGSVHTPRTTVEWQCDPSSGFSLEQISGFDQLLVVVCNGGYSSSIVAANLQRLGFSRATDMIGGVAAWLEAGLAVVPPDYTHLGG